MLPVIRNVLACILVLATAANVGWPQNSPQQLSADSLERLIDTEVTTVSRIPERRSRVPAAVYVITQEDIRRSGATSIPEALRLAPGVQVARIDSNTWAIGIRGFTSRLTRSMLVLIDGRAVYTPLFAGTYWDVQDTLLEDIDRIEVIRGPGGILWGANAVNGIINIITKDARITQGTLVTAGGGSEEQGFAGFRYGDRMGQDSYYRVYGKFFNRDAAYHPDGHDFDGWRMGQTGFRADWALPQDRTLTLQSDFYKGVAGHRTSINTLSPPFVRPIEDDADLSGGNFLARWGGPAGERSDVKLQVYYDRTNRDDPTFRENRDTLDLDFQNHFYPVHRNEIVWGFGYRMSSGDFRGKSTTRFVPDRRTDHLVSGFLQDEVELVSDRLYAIVGAKLEHNGYSGFEAQPNGKLLWTPSPQHTFRVSVARAVRTPSRIEHDLEATSVVEPTGPTFSRFNTSKAFESEKLIAYEVGYRIRPTERLFVTAAGFFNQHGDLLSIETGTPFREDSPPPPHLVLPIAFGNGLEGNSRGLELTSDWRVKGWWRLNGAYSYLRINLKRKPDSRDFSTERSTEGASPHHQVSFQSSMNLAAGVEFDWTLRFVSELPSPSQRIPSYTTSDVRLGWRPTGRVELSLVGQNLHQPHHAEFSGGGASGVVQIERSAYGKITWQW